MLGGRIAEKIFFDNISTGAQDDLQKVTRLAYGIVTVYGMTDKIGHMSYPQPQDGQMNSTRPYSEEIASIVDEEVRQIVWFAYDRTYELLTEKKEVVLREDVVEILGPRIWNDAMTYQEIIDSNAKQFVPDDPPPPAGPEPGLAACSPADPEPGRRRR